MAFTPIILTHVLAASSAVFVGGAALLSKKGTPLHRLLGRGWVILMLIAVLSSFGIKTHGHYSWIHLLSIIAIAGLAGSIYAVAKGNIRAHQRGMRSLYISLVVAGTFTLLPQRLLGHLVWQSVGLI
jgi:uncharacterized membrane protein